MICDQNCFNCPYDDCVAGKGVPKNAGLDQGEKDSRSSYWRNHDKRLAYVREYNNKNIDKSRAYRRKYYQEHREQMIANAKARYRRLKEAENANTGSL